MTYKPRKRENPRFEVRFYSDEKGYSQSRDWFLSLSETNPKALVKAKQIVWRLGQEGLDLRRPEADVVDSPIRELRTQYANLTLRIYYWHQGGTLFMATAAETKKQSRADPELIAYAKMCFDDFQKRLQEQKDESKRL